MAEKKQIICPNCQAKLKFDPDKITSEVVKFKCPGCSAVLRLRKPGEQKEASPVGEKSREKLSGAGQKTEVPPSDPREEAGEYSGAEPEEPRESEGEAHAPLETKQDEQKHGPLIPPEKLVGPKGPGESLLEDFDHANLHEYEEGEADPGDLEWTRYADKKGPQLPESKIDLNLIPATADGLQDTLADLQQAEMYNLQGEANLEKNLIRQAIRDFNHALEINPNYVDALVNRGSAYVLQNEFNAALTDFNHALDLENRQAEIYKIRGEIYLLNRMYDEAIKDFTAAILLNPMYSDAYLNRAKAYNEKGMKEEAEADFNQAIRADSDKFASYTDLAGSEALFDDESDSHKDKVANFLKQGLEELKNENYYEAIENFSQVISIAPETSQAYVNRGQAYIEIGQPDEAMVDLNRAALYDPLNPALYYWRALAWKTLNSPLNMVADFKLACELGYGPACEEYEKHKPRKH